MAFKGDPEIQKQKGTNLDLGTKDLDTVCEELVEVRAKWWLIGLKLKLTSGTLDEIKQEKTNRLEAVLLHWLRVTIGASWEQVIDALRSAQVGEIRLAEKLELKYCPPEKTGHGEKRKYRSDDEQQLTNDIKNIKKKFANLQTATRESLKKCNVELMSLVALLTSYRTSRSVIESENKMLLAHQQEELRRAASVDEIFVIISPFSSFLDFEILEDVIEKFGAESDQRDLATYFIELKKFLNTWKVEPCKISRLDDDKSRIRLCFKLDTDSLAIYRDLKAAIARIFKVDVYALHLHSIEPGCIQLIFFCLEIVPIMALRSDQIAQIIPSVLKVSLIHGSTSEVLFEREDQNPSPPHSSVSVAGTTVQSEIVVGAGGFHVEELGGKTIQESHDKKWYQRLFSWRTSQRAGEEAESKTTPSPGETVEPTVTSVTEESSESPTRGKRWYQRFFPRHSSRRYSQERMDEPKTTSSPGETVEPTVTRVTKESSESSTREKRWYQRLFSRHSSRHSPRYSSRQERMDMLESGGCPPPPRRSILQRLHISAYDSPTYHVPTHYSFRDTRADNI